MPFRPDFPLPDRDWPPTQPFWAAAARGELSVPRCDACGGWVWYPDGPCRSCAGTAHTWTTMSGRGRVFSWSVVRRAFIPQLADAVPFVATLVSLEEAPAVRLATRVVDCDPAAVRIDMPVRAVFRPLRFTGVAGEVIAPLFVPA